VVRHCQVRQCSPTSPLLLGPSMSGPAFSDAPSNSVNPPGYSRCSVDQMDADRRPLCPIQCAEHIHNQSQNQKIF